MSITARIKYTAHFNSLDNISSEAKRYIYPKPELDAYIADCYVKDNVFHFTCLNLINGEEVEKHFTSPLENLDYILEWVKKGYMRYQRKRKFSKELQDFIDIESMKPCETDLPDMTKND